MTPEDRIIEDPLTRQRLTFLDTAAATDGRSLRAEVRLEPGGFVPRHLHLCQDERLEVLGGSIRLRARGEDRILGPGDTSLISRRRIHRVANAGPDEARFVLEVHPPRHMERTLRSIFAIGRVVATVSSAVRHPKAG